MPSGSFDAIVVGSGPNGLSAAVTLARAGLSVRVYERNATIGGGARTENVDGNLHDICSAVHPMAFASSFFQAFGLRDRVDFVTPEISYAHPLDGGRAGLAWRDLERTAADLGRDGAAWKQLFGKLVEHAVDVGEFTADTLLRIPSHPFVAADFGLRALEQGSPLWNLRWREDAAPALLSGVMSHAIKRMPGLGPAAVALSLGTNAHVDGWPIPIGGSQKIVDALAADLVAHGGEIVLDTEITSLDELPKSRVTLLDTTAPAMLRLAGDKLPEAYRKRVSKFKTGNAASRVDFVLSGPVPWANEEIAKSGTVHVGGTRRELARAEAYVAAGRHAPKPYVLVSQPSGFDPTRSADGNHTLWTYSHVPRDSNVDQTEPISAQLERFAPGFRDLIISSRSRTAVDLENYNPNYIGGDIATGDGGFTQLVARPVLSPNPWRTPLPGLYLASAAAAPGPGVHGLVGWNAALSALRDRFDIQDPPDLAPDSTGSAVDRSKGL